MPVYFEAYFSFLLSLVFIGNILFWRHLEEIDLGKDSRIITFTNQIHSFDNTHKYMKEQGAPSVFMPSLFHQY